MRAPTEPEPTQPPRRPWRRALLGKIVVAGSIVGLVALAALWVRSMLVDEHFNYRREVLRPRGTSGNGSTQADQFQLVAGQGVVALTWTHKVTPQAIPTKTWSQLLGTYPRSRYGYVRGRGWAILDDRAGPVSLFRTFRVVQTPTRWGGFDAVVAAPIWLAMLPLVVPPIWWFWCLPGRAWPRLSIRRLGLVVAGAAIVAAGLSLLSRAAIVGTMTGSFQVLVNPAFATVPGSEGTLRLTVRGGDVELRRALATLPPDRKLVRLDIPSGAVTDAGMSQVRGLVDLKHLSLRGCVQLTDLGLANLKGLKRLRSLDLDYTGVTDAGMALVAGFAAMETLSLDHTGVGDAGLRHLAGLAHLDSINLTATRVTDAGLPFLGASAQLRSVTDSGTTITLQGWEALGRTVPRVAAQVAERAALANDDATAFRHLAAWTDRQRQAWVALVRASSRANDLLFHIEDSILADQEAGGPDEALRLAESFQKRWSGLNGRIQIQGDEAYISRVRMIREAGRWQVDLLDWDNRTVDEAIRVAAPLAEAMAEFLPDARHGKYAGADRAAIRAFKQAFTDRAKAADLRLPPDDRHP